MSPEIFRILERKRQGATLAASDIRQVVAGAADGAWGDAELGAFLMASAIHGLDPAETRELTLAMFESGESWQLRQEFPGLGDKHSTGGVGDKVSLVLAPIMAACDRPIVMLTGRGLGHTGGTADKLEVIPGLDLSLDREGCLAALAASGIAIGLPTRRIAPADGRLYSLRDRTATIASLPLITGSILSKKLATGAAAIVFDVKVGNGAFLTDLEQGLELGRLLVETAEALGIRARSLVTDMNQPLGRFVGHAAELREALDALAGDGPPDLMEVVYTLCEELSSLTGERLTRQTLQEAVSSGRARERFDRWALCQGAEAGWLRQPRLPLAAEEVAVTAAHGGRLAKVASRRLGELLTAAGGGRQQPGAPIDEGVSVEMRCKLGDSIEAGDELARLYLRHQDPLLVARFRECFEVAPEAAAEPRILSTVDLPEGSSRQRPTTEIQVPIDPHD